MYTTELYKLNDARRMAATMVRSRNAQGESITVTPATINRMGKIAANVLAGYASRPAYFRTARLVNAKTKSVTFRIGGAY